MKFETNFATFILNTDCGQFIAFDNDGNNLDVGVSFASGAKPDDEEIAYAKDIFDKYDDFKAHIKLLARDRSDSLVAPQKINQFAESITPHFFYIYRLAPKGNLAMIVFVRSTLLESCNSAIFRIFLDDSAKVLDGVCLSTIRVVIDSKMLEKAVEKISDVNTGNAPA